ncbi:MAG: DUF924 family protein [Pseudomonadota bacterium]
MVSRDIHSEDNLPDAEAVLRFWFEELSPKQHFLKDPALDFQIKNRFETLHQHLLSAGTAEFAATPRAKLAAIIVLDQFSRNMFRGHKRAFSGDHYALALAKELVASAADSTLSVAEKTFAYMPYMHSEDLADQEEAVRLFDQSGLEDNLDYAIRHRDVIRRFGRFPHRNICLGRPSTAEEQIFVETPGTAF